MYLIDTNIVSDARRNSPPVVRWLRSVDSQLIYLSVITLGEINRGVEKQRTKDPALADRLLLWLQTLRHEHRHRTLPVTEEIAMVWGRISSGRSRGIADELIAATAAVHGLVVITRNTADFDATGVPVVNPWNET